ncbi:dynein light chain Tctex-type 1-like [Hylaeus volcanicus]|uniref:dynein light chain Tctex-type 1-like n=1 Tax=Hylaeus volcanicus TaxID=313075 RepID=UPI0023B7CE55|nr:dynein light chain Tctex-type 1-like [Hylaeus volcanicus]
MPVKESLTISKPQPFSTFNDRVKQYVTTSVENVLGAANYDAAEVPTWVDTITAIVMLQRTNTGFHLFSTCFWDQSSDGTVTVQWENKSMHCVVTVYGIAV